MAVEKRTGNVVKVDVAQFLVGGSPMQMMTMALGSCLGIVLYDPSTGIGALAHAMHPRRERVKNNANRAKFVDTVIPAMIEQMLQGGARRGRIDNGISGRGGAHGRQGCGGGGRGGQAARHDGPATSAGPTT